MSASVEVNKPVGEPTFEDCQRVLSQHEAHLLALPDVLGVGVGKSDDGRLGLVVLVRALTSEDRGRESATLPTSLDGIPVWPRSIGSVSAQQDEILEL